jgi:hypothetical protein
VTIPFVIVMFQFYSWIVSLQGVDKQRHCKALGIVYTTLGTCCFIFRTLPFAIAGLLIFMLGLRLIANGLDRINKTTFIDRLDEDSPLHGPVDTAPSKATLADSLPTGTDHAGDDATVAMRLDLARE